MIAIIGICLISFTGVSELELNPMGDFLAVAAALIWAAYSTITKKISSLGYDTILTTRRTFFYGIVFMIPICGGLRFPDYFSLRSRQAQNFLNLAFLGFGASALCFRDLECCGQGLGSG